MSKTKKPMTIKQAIKKAVENGYNPAGELEQLIENIDSVKEKILLSPKFWKALGNNRRLL